MEKPEAYREKMEAQLRELRGKIEILRGKLSKAKADTKIEIREELDILEKKRAAFEQKVKKLRDSGSSAFEELKVGVQNAYDDLKRALDSAFSKFK